MSVPDPALTDWVPLYPAGAQPIPPVQDGKWLKGQGGAMVWADLPASTLPDRLGTTAAYPPGDNWDNAVESGWYMSGTAVNGPFAGWVIGQVWQHNNLWATQEVWAFTDEQGAQRRYRREKRNGGWGTWRRVLPSSLSGEVDVNGNIVRGSGFGIAKPAGNDFRIYPSPAFQYTPIVLATVTGAQGDITVALSSPSEIQLLTYDIFNDANARSFMFALFVPG